MLGERTHSDESAEKNFVFWYMEYQEMEKLRLFCVFIF